MDVEEYIFTAPILAHLDTRPSGDLLDEDNLVAGADNKYHMLGNLVADAFNQYHMVGGSFLRLDNFFTVLKDCGCH